MINLNSRAQWVKDPLWVDLHDMIAKMPDMETHPKTWLTENDLLEIGDPSQREDLALHDPQQHGQFFKRNHFLPQDNWIPASSHPSPEEFKDAVNDLSLYSEQVQAKAVALLSSKFIPHDQHEYTIQKVCSKCSNGLAYSCHVR